MIPIMVLLGVGCFSAALFLCPTGARWYACWWIGHALRMEHIYAEIRRANELAAQATRKAREGMEGR